MIVALWIIIKITFVSCGLFLIFLLLKSFQRDDQETFIQGLKTALADCGFFLKRKKYSLELYKWVIDDHEEVCEESLERSEWPAMDIADWMKAGLPCSVDGETLCGQDCSCQLVLYKKVRVPSSKS